MLPPWIVQVPPLELLDPLGEVLGALAPGEAFSYSITDVVKLSGHSCPTVAGAFLMTRVALAKLWPGGPAVRGGIRVVVGATPDDPALGPMSQVIAMITGAAPETGFAGLMGKFRRRGLLTFDPDLDGWIRFVRVDSGASIECRFDASSVPSEPGIGELMALVLAGAASEGDRRRFGEAWQRRVGRLLLGDADRLVKVRGVRGVRP